MLKIELEPQYDSRKSFYGKAKYEVIEQDGTRFFNLYSYGTLVATAKQESDGKMSYTHLGKYSQTTSRHQREFFKQMGLSDKEIKFLEKNVDEEICFDDCCQGY